MLGTIESIHSYPLTGAHAVDLSSATVNNGGIVGDHEFVLYLPGQGPDGLGARVNQLSSTKARRLTLVHASDIITEEGHGVELLLPDPFESITIIDTDETDLPTTSVDEFGVSTPVVDQGDANAAAFESLIEMPGVRLGRKTLQWRWPTVNEASARKVRPVHFVTTSTVEELQVRSGAKKITAARFRPTLVINTDAEPFSENRWVGKTLVIDGLQIAVTKLTARCPIPSYDQDTGANEKDVAKLYSELEKDHKNKPVVGVYGQPMLDDYWDARRIAVGQSVHFL